MSNIFIIDDRPDDHPEVIERREKEWKELPPEVRERIESVNNNKWINYIRNIYYS